MVYAGCALPDGGDRDWIDREGLDIGDSDWLFRTQGTFAGARNRGRLGSRTAPRLHRLRDAARAKSLLFRDYAARRDRGSHHRVRDAEVWAGASRIADCRFVLFDFGLKKPLLKSAIQKSAIRSFLLSRRIGRRCCATFFLVTRHQAEFFQLVAQGVAADVEKLRGLRLISV